MGVGIAAVGDHQDGATLALKMGQMREDNGGILGVQISSGFAPPTSAAKGRHSVTPCKPGHAPRSRGKKVRYSSSTPATSAPKGETWVNSVLACAPRWQNWVTGRYNSMTFR